MPSTPAGFVGSMSRHRDETAEDDIGRWALMFVLK